MLLIGPPGVGKSHLAQAIGAEVAKSGKSVLYRSIFDVVAELLDDDLAERHHKTMTRYLKCDLLIIDDMGIKQLPPKSWEYLFEIVMRRYEAKATMMTANRPLEEWGKLIGDVPAATAILDRFLHHANVIKISGRSYRLRNQACPEQPENTGKRTLGVVRFEVMTGGTFSSDVRHSAPFFNSRHRKRQYLNKEVKSTARFRKCLAPNDSEPMVVLFSKAASPNR